MDIVPVDTKGWQSLLQHTMCLCIKIFLLLWLIARCISAKTLREKYRQKFPNEDIHAVVRRLVLSYVRKWGDNINE